MFEAFATAIRNPGAGMPGDVIDRGNRFSVYRNNFQVGLSEALSTSFPVTSMLVGAEYFEALAEAYVHKEPPKSPLLLEHGASFPDFLEGFPPLQELPYLPDVARVEWARVFAADAALEDRSSVATETDLTKAIERPVRLSVSATLLRSNYPVGSIWDNHQKETVDPVSDWSAEVVVVWWGGERVMQAVLSPELEMVLSGIDGKTPFVDILSDAANEQQAVSMLTAFTTLMNQGLLVLSGPDNGAY